MQAVMFAYDIGIPKREDRLQAAFDRVAALAEEFKDIVPTPYCSVTLPRRKPSRLVAQASVAGV